MRIKGGRPPLAGGRTGAVDSSSPTHKGSINQMTSSVRGSFGALPLRPTAMIRRTFCEVLLCASVYYAAGITAFDGWICRVDVIRVGADLRVRPQNSYAQVRTGGHTGPPLRWKLPPRRAVHPKRSRPSFRNEKKLRFLLAYELRKQLITCLALMGTDALSLDTSRASLQLITRRELPLLTKNKLTPRVACTLSVSLHISR